MLQWLLHLVGQIITACQPCQDAPALPLPWLCHAGSQLEEQLSEMSGRMQARELLMISKWRHLLGIPDTHMVATPSML
jgi:hypothetical protein